MPNAPHPQHSEPQHSEPQHSQLGRTLRDQHWQIRQYLEVVSTAASDERRPAFEEFASTLEAHEGFEAAAVYPLIGDTAEDAAAIIDARSTEEAAIMKQIGVLRTADTSTSQWLADFTLLMAELNAHLAAEENSVIPLVDKLSRA